MMDNELPKTADAILDIPARTLDRRDLIRRWTELRDKVEQLRRDAEAGGYISARKEPNLP